MRLDVAGPGLAGQACQGADRPGLAGKATMDEARPRWERQEWRDAE